MRLLYDIILIFLGLLILPSYILQKKFSLEVFKEKISPCIKKGKQKRVWIQAVSVGEVLLLKRLVRELKERNIPLAISTSTPSGFSVAKKNYSEYADIFYFPFDLTPIIKKSIKKIDPYLFISVETEIWPNLFRELDDRGVPIIIINARLSKKSLPKYLLIKNFIKKVLNKCTFIAVQNEYYLNCFLRLGVDAKKLIIGGNMKFSSIIVEDKDIAIFLQKNPYLEKFKDKYLLFIGGSLHKGEEEILIEVYKNLVKDHPKLRLILASRHIERIPHIEKILQRYQLRSIRTSKKDIEDIDKDCVLIIDSMGELLLFYSTSYLAFVGGSLVNFGGHNIIEPAYFGKPVIFGPYMDNFLEMKDMFLKNNAACQVKDKGGLEEITGKLLEDKSFYNTLSYNAQKLLKSEENKWQKTWDLIEKLL